MKHDIALFSKVIGEFDFNSRKIGIGTLGEKVLHAIIKSYYEPDEEFQEVSVNSFVADIKRGDEIVEIQTTSFNLLNKKLEKYLDSYSVTVVFPIALNKHIVWLDKDSGEVVSKNKSNKKGRAVEFLYEASKIRKHLNCGNLRFEILLIDMDEYRLLDGYGKDKKKRCTKLYKMPTALIDYMEIESADDVKKILPPEVMDGRFTFGDFEKITKLKNRRARYSLNALIEFGIVRKVDKIGKADIFEAVN